MSLDIPVLDVQLSFTLPFTTPSWTDVSGTWKSIKTTHGKQHEFDRFEAGTAQILFDGANGDFSPFNTAGPYYGKLLPMVTVRIIAVWASDNYSVWYGYADSWQQQWPGPFYSDVMLSASDGLKGLNLASIFTEDYPTLVNSAGALAYFPMDDPIDSTEISDSSPANIPAALGGTWGTTGQFIPTDSGGYGSGARLSDPTAGWLQLRYGGVPTGNATLDPAVGSGYTQGTYVAWVNLAGDSSAIWATAENTLGNSFSIYTIGGLLYADLFAVAVAGGLTNIVDGHWHMVACTLSLPGYAGVMTLYVDGVSAGTVAVGGSIDPSLYYLNNLSIGLVGGAFGLDGNIQDAAFYGGILSPAQIQQQYLCGIAGWTQQDTGARIQAILNDVSVPSGLTDIPSGTVDIQALGQSTTPESALSYVNQVLDTEEGRFYQDADGIFYFRPRGFTTTNARSLTPQTIFDDAGGGVPYEVASPDLILDDLDIYNQAVITCNGFTTGIGTDGPSVGQYLTREIQRDTLHVSDSDTLTHADYLVNEYKQPVRRVQSIVVDLFSEGLGSSILPQTLGLFIYDLVTVNRHVLADGSEFSQNAFVEGIDHDIQADPPKWEMTFHLSAVA